MTVKRSASSSPPLSDNEVKPTTPKKAKKPSASKSSPAKSSPAKSEDGTTVSDGQWTGEKKGQLLELLIGVGLANTKPAELADQFGVTKTQILNMFNRGRSNLRSKVVAYAQTL